MIIANPTLSGSVNISGSLLLNGSSIGATSVTSSLALVSERVRAGSSGSRPTDYANIETGSLWYNTDTLALEIFTGVSQSWWQSVGSGSSVVGTPLPSTLNLEYLLVAGGGGAGGYDGSDYQVGDAGTDSSIAGASITTITANGGGRGAVWNKDGSQDGGSGGGASGNRSAGSGTVGQGNDGGAAYGSAQADVGSGGGGGAGASGTAGTNSKYGDGGDGLQSSITGISTYYAGGGGAGGWNQSGVMTQGLGGQGGGGNGTVEVSDGNSANVGNPGASNTGGGAGAGDYGIGANHGGGGAGGLLSSSLSSVTSGSSFTVTVGGGGAAGGSYGAAGGSGVAIFAYESGSTSSRLAGGIVGDAGNGNKYHQFNSSGTLKVGSASDFQIVTNNLLINLDASDLNSYSGSGNTWTDVSGQSNDFSLRNSPTYSTPLGGAFTLNGSNQDILLGTTPTQLQGNPNLTVSGWFKRTGNLSTNQGSWGIGGDVQNEGICSWNETLANEITIDVWSSGTFTSGAEYTLNGWTFVTWQKAAGAMTRANCTLWKNLTSYTGNQLTIVRPESGTPNINTQGVVIGRIHSGYSTPLALQVAHFMVYDRVLTAAEIEQNYNATKTNFV